MPNPFTGTTGNDSINIASLQGTGVPQNNAVYTIDGGAGIDTFSLTSSGGAYNIFPRANFTISATDAAGVTTISGASAGGSLTQTFKLLNVESLVFKDATVALGSGPAVADTTAPVYASGAANATSVVLTYTDTNNLDATNKPPLTAFAVSGAASGTHTISSVAVNAAAKTVTLTLGTAVTIGESLTVTYTDPTAANDTLAIQDVSGNDAATSTHAITVISGSIGDTTAPTITTYSPADGLTNADTYSNIDITFNEAITFGTASSIQLHSGSAAGTVVSSSTSISGNTLTIDPTANLAYNTHYFVSFSSSSSSSSSSSGDNEHDNEHGGSNVVTTTYGITDIAGNNFTGTNVYDFTTGADPFAPATNAMVSGGPVVVGVGGLGMLAWAFLL